MKSKILSLAVIAGIFSGCAELPTLSLPTLPKKEINTELIKDIKTDGKGCYIPMSDDDCYKMRKAGLLQDSWALRECKSVALRNPSQIILESYFKIKGDGTDCQ